MPLFGLVLAVSLAQPARPPTVSTDLIVRAVNEAGESVPLTRAGVYFDVWGGSARMAEAHDAAFKAAARVLRDAPDGVERFLVANGTGFGDAEALYASYALHPQPAYLDHPGLVGFVARALGAGGAPTPQTAHVFASVIAKF